MAGLLCVGSKWSPPLGDAFRKALVGQPEAKRIDLGCVLDHGAFEISNESGNAEITTSSGKDALIWFAIRLFQRLQRLATAPAIDIERYGRRILMLEAGTQLSLLLNMVPNDQSSRPRHCFTDGQELMLAGLEV